MSRAQTGSSLSALGDINADGFDDLMISAKNVAYAPSGNYQGSDAQLTTGLRVVLGAATATALSSANNPNASEQTIQIANLYRQPNVSSGANPVTPFVNLSGPAKLNLCGGQDGRLVQITSPATGSTLSTSSLIASASNPSSLNQLFSGATATTTSSPTWSANAGSGSPSLLTSGGFGDLNADGYVDYLDEIPTTVYGPGGMSWSVWSIRAAGDANGNGVDDVLLSLAPQGPAYKQVTGGQPSALQSVLVDGSLFSVDKSTNTFRLDQLRTPLNPYNRSQLFDVASTSTSDYLPSLQNWFEPILNFKPGSLTAASTATSINPDGARSYFKPAVAISPDGGAYLVISGATTSGTSGASGLWMAYQQAGSWKQTPQLPFGTDASRYSPSATFYQGKLYIAYSDTSGNLHIASSDDSPENISATNWHSYQVKTTDNNNSEINESTDFSPTLVAEAGRLALYFPSNTPNTSQQNLLYLYSTDPDNSRSGNNAYGNWGRSLNTTTGGFNGNSYSIDTGGNTVSAPIAATTFHGRTVLAFRSEYLSGHIFLLTQVSSTPTWKLTDTGISNVLGIALTSDQSLLYLTSGSPSNDDDPSSNILSLRLNADGSWTQASQQTVSGNQSLGGFEYEVINPFLSGGQLMAAWTDSSYNIQVASLNTTITAPSQQSLAGYSIDGNIDINGDGFKDVLISDSSDPTQSVDNQYALFGGDYLNIASQVGTTGNDILLGTPLADVIFTLQGADQVASHGGADVIYTGTGDDSISITNNAFIRIDAGSGFDVLSLEGKANKSYDFSLNMAAPEYFAGTKLRDIELISSQDYGANTLRFDAAAVNTINPDRTLFLTPDAVDTVVLTSEFQHNSAFDTTYGGSLWNAYAAGAATTPAHSSPTLLYVLNPNGAADSDWLNAHVVCLDTPAEPVAASLQASTTLGAMLSASGAPGAAVTGNQGSTIRFGKGLTLTAFTTTSSSQLTRFSIQRDDASSNQVVTYTTSSQNAMAAAGADHSVASGQVVFRVGDTVKEVWVPLVVDALRDRKASSISLEVQEQSFSDQKEVHVLIQSLKDALSGRRPVLSGVSLDVNEKTGTANLWLRSDTNSGEQEQLKLQISIRDRADTLVLSDSQELTLADFRADGNFTIPLNPRDPLPLDLDGRSNQQVGAHLRFNLEAGSDLPLVSLLGPELTWQSSVQLLNGNKLHFSQDAPLTSWRADSGPGLVSFGLQSTTANLTLITAASGGTAGSLNPTNANDDSGANGWQSTEALAVGSRAITAAPNLSGSDWTPTASQDGVSLALLNLAVAGNQVTATFTGGVTGIFWQATGNAPTVLPGPAAVEVQRLASNANSLGFYTVDSITGNVEGLNPGDPDYLQAALARSQEEGLLLEASSLPAFGASTRFNALPLSIRSGGGTSAKTSVTSICLGLFWVISLQPRRGSGGSEGAAPTFRRLSGHYQ